LMNWEDLMGHFGVTDIKEDYTRIMNPLSELYNIFHVDFQRPYIITEGTMDCNSLSNSFAICGATKNFNIKGRYLMDNDPAGKKASLKAMEAGNEVFLWDKFMEEENIDPDLKLKDINDIIVKTSVPESDLSAYFSNDELDLIWV